MSGQADQEVPLCVDLDGTLLATDTLHEALLALARQRPQDALLLPFWLLRGKARLKRLVAERVELDPRSLPYREDVVEFLRTEADRGRRLLLTTASDERAARPIAEHLGIFDGVIASDGRSNWKGEAKLEAIRAQIGDGAFDYVGDSSADLPIWRAARRAYAVDPSRATLRRLEEIRPPERVFPGPKADAACVLRALRPHQWTKNVLLAVPLATSHSISRTDSVVSVFVGMLAFSLVASAGYVINDLLDLAADRAHPVKRRRPFASGSIPVAAGPAMIVSLLAAGCVVAGILLPPAFLLTLGLYFILTLSYSILVKRKLLADVLLLAGLYTLRIFAGGAAIDVVLSEWLLAFSVFLFLSLAFAKRYSELLTMLEEERPQAKGRGYFVEDMGLVMNVGATSGMISVLVFSLYINLSEEVKLLYERSAALWLACPILLYWILRIWFLARRGELPGDPVTFALTDRHSYVLGVLAVLVFLAAGPA